MTAGSVGLVALLVLAVAPTAAPAQTAPPTPTTTTTTAVAATAAAAAGVITLQPKLLTATRGVVWSGAVASFTDSAPGPVRDPRAYIASAYTDVLGRAVGAGELAYWTFVLEQRVPRLRLTQALLASDEWRRFAVQGLYLYILGRAAKPADINFWAGRLAAGATLDGVRAQLYGSAEYLSHAGGSASGFVAALYLDVLRRAADPAGAAHFTALVNTGTSRAAVAGVFLASAEGRARQVASYWTSLLGHPPTAAQASSWVALLAAGTPEPRLVSELVASAEYYSGLPSGYTVSVAWSGGTGSSGAVLRSTAGTTINVLAGRRFTANGTYTATVQVTPAGGSPTTTTSTIVAYGPRNERFVQELYRDLLLREADAGALVYFRGYLAAGGSPRRRSAAGLVLVSTEYRRKAAAAIYQAYVGRTTTAAESDAGLYVIAAGQPYNAVRATVLGSAEYYGDHGSTVNGFLDGLYADVLGRAPSAAERAADASRLASGTTRTVLARGLLDGTAARAVLVRAAYDLILERAPTSGEVTTFVAQLGTTLTEPGLYANLAASIELFESYPRA